VDREFLDTRQRNLTDSILQTGTWAGQWRRHRIKPRKSAQRRSSGSRGAATGNLLERRTRRTHPPLQASLRSLGKSINPHILRSGYVQRRYREYPGDPDSFSPADYLARVLPINAKGFSVPIWGPCFHSYWHMTPPRPPPLASAPRAGFEPRRDHRRRPHESRLCMSAGSSCARIPRFG
jgi:hypothetical protein